MPPLPDALGPLAAALADRYRLEREIGRGGMATVYLAHDLRHDRPVALKVLRPELGAVLGPDRFNQEIRIAARLRHPHILPVHDSGEAAGRLWYTMPFVEGESLRQRLTREHALPLDQAVRIAGQVLSALGHAHAHGIIHRDIKPENILLEDGEAVVADFGVACAVTEAGQERLTETGLALGTPAYMSPEQASASREFDGRSDLYAVGCVLYEMLAGQPPFSGVTAQQILARHALDPVPPLRSVRDTVSESLERSVTRALAKLPADRFATAQAFTEALTAPGAAAATPVATPAGQLPSPAPAARGPARRRAIALAAGALALGLAAYLAYRWWPRPPTALDPNLVAVVPFRVAGAAPDLGYLREGMMDLVAARLTGEGGARATDPRSVMAAWRQAGRSGSDDLPEAAALGLARRLGAGQLLLGGIVGTSRHLALNASLLAVEGGGRRAEARVEGPTDSLPQLVDRLAAQLITEGPAGSHGLDALVNTPLPALRLYLEGLAAQRRGDYPDAVARFSQALDRDSTFAQAGLVLASAAGWTVTPGSARRGLELAWASRNRLRPSDQALVFAEVGPDYPATSTLTRFLAAWERAVDLGPDQADRWYELGDLYYHEGTYLQLDASRRRAAEAFRRSVALDSGTGPLGHLVEIALMEGDSASVRRLGALYLAHDTSGELLDFLRWRIADGLHDERALMALRARYGQLKLPSLWRIMNYAVLDGRRLEDAESAAVAIRAVAGRGSDWQRSKTYLHAFEVNRGHPSVALGDTAGTDETEYGPHAALYQRVLDALYGDGDRASGAAAARELDRGSGGPLPASGDARAVAQTDLCVATLWRLSQGDAAGAVEAVARLRQPAPDEAPATRTGNTVCAALLEAKLAARAAPPDTAGTGGAVDRLDALIRSGPGGQRNGPSVAFTLSPAYIRSTIGISPVGFEDFVNLEVARIRERQGDLRAALRAVRRRSYSYHLTDYLATHLREEGRLAALTGDRAGAIRAWRHYLALRSDAEPALRPGIDSVRAELAKLGGPRN
ncbi:MAG TPA: serine/threonine-protein kinase [Gemmatimonadales bacterium]|nr:serine/threonine-protein kinase [Gemmatimonadales bacterium]